MKPNNQKLPSEHDSYQISLKLILKNREGEILVLTGKPGGSYDGFFVLPGGRINTDEFDTNLMNVLRREVLEEVGNIKFEVDAKPVAVGRHFVPGANRKDGKDLKYFYVFFEGQYKGGDIKLDTHEHLGYQWIDLADLELDKYFTSGILEGLKMYRQNVN